MTDAIRLLPKWLCTTRVTAPLPAMSTNAAGVAALSVDDLVVTDHAVVDSLRGERIDVGGAGQSDGFGSRFGALF